MIFQDHSHDSSQDLEDTLTIHESDHEGVIIGRQTLWTLCNRNAHYYYPSTSLAGFLARAPRHSLLKSVLHPPMKRIMKGIMKQP